MTKKASLRGKLRTAAIYCIAAVFIAPVALNFLSKDNATLTIVSDQATPFTFVLQDDGGIPNPFNLNCQIEVKSGIGRFTNGSFEHMNYYGLPSYFTRSSRRLIVKMVDSKGNLKAQPDDLVMSFEEDPQAPHKRRFYVQSLNP